MTRLTTTKGEFLLVEVSKYSHDCTIVCGDLICYAKDGQCEECIENMPDGYEFIATTDSLTEEQAAGIVDLVGEDFEDGQKYYRNYRGKPSEETAEESFYSLMLANDIDTSKNYAILKLVQ